jgi:magnesium-transporting ATPase (P-type)
MLEAGRSGQRVLALARREIAAGTTALDVDDIQPGFTLLGLAGMIDPPRPEAIPAVAECPAAGIRVKMITGDVVERLSDAALRRRVRETDVIARASPEHKLRLVAALQAEGEFVAMTGDGVNDAPALKSAEIGVAMGHRGPDAAKEASDLVLTDDNFASIAQAVHEGRRVFDNIKKSLVFILPTNGAQAGVILVAVLAGVALPITASQILWVNRVTAVTLPLALALAFEPADEGVMRRPPRPPKEPLITQVMLVRIVFVSVLMIALTFGVYEWELMHGQSLDLAAWGLILGLSVFAFFAVVIEKGVRRRLGIERM